MSSIPQFSEIKTANRLASKKAAVEETWHWYTVPVARHSNALLHHWTFYCFTECFIILQIFINNAASYPTEKKFQERLNL